MLCTLCTFYLIKIYLHQSEDLFVQVNGLAATLLQLETRIEPAMLPTFSFL
jgi:hypothetical protein